MSYWWRKQPLEKGSEVSRTMELEENDVTMRSKEMGALVIEILPTQQTFLWLQDWHSDLPGCHPQHSTSYKLLVPVATFCSSTTCIPSFHPGDGPLDTGIPPKRFSECDIWSPLSEDSGSPTSKDLSLLCIRASFTWKSITSWAEIK